MSEPTRDPLLSVNHLAVEFSLGRRRPPLRAVDDVTLNIGAAETVGLVGESGSGKTTIGRAILGLTPVTEGEIYFDGANITRASYRERRTLSAEMQVVFQDPYSSLNPTRTIGQTLGEMLRAGKSIPKAKITERVGESLARVGLPQEAMRKYPGHFSGGQRQRIAIARALIVDPRLVVCDEPVSALDLSVQAQVLNLLRDLQKERSFAYLFISHDLAVVRHIAQRIIVLYRGRIMEEGPARVVYDEAVHPYTRALLSSAPIPDPEEQRRRRERRAATIVQPVGQLSANSCPFVPRCPYAIDICRSSRPPLERTPTSSLVACHRWPELVTSNAAPELPLRSAARSRSR